MDEIDSKNKLSFSSSNLDKRSKRSRFDLKKTFQRSRSMCVNQFNSWLQRRRQRHLSVERRKSATESKASSPCSTPRLLGSPRLARLHQKLFKSQVPPPSKTDHTSHPTQILDDSDNRSQYDLPVRIYFPPLTPPISRHVRITNVSIETTNNNRQDIDIDQTLNLTTPIIHRKYSSSSSSKKTTAKERRESFATLSNMFNHRFL
jgi:hypothetical protein